MSQAQTSLGLKAVWSAHLAFTLLEFFLSITAHIIALLHVGLIKAVYLTACALSRHHDVALFK